MEQFNPILGKANIVTELTYQIGLYKKIMPRQAGFDAPGMLQHITGRGIIKKIGVSQRHLTKTSKKHRFRNIRIS